MVYNLPVPNYGVKSRYLKRFGMPLVISTEYHLALNCNSYECKLSNPFVCILTNHNNHCAGTGVDSTIAYRVFVDSACDIKIPPRCWRIAHHQNQRKRDETCERLYPRTQTKAYH